MGFAQQTFYQFAGADSRRELTKFLDALRWLEQTSKREYESRFAQARVTRKKYWGNL